MQNLFNSLSNAITWAIIGTNKIVVTPSDLTVSGGEWSARFVPAPDGVVIETTRFEKQEIGTLETRVANEFYRTLGRWDQVAEMIVGEFIQRHRRAGS